MPLLLLYDSIKLILNKHVGFQIAQVRAIFSFPRVARDELPPNVHAPKHLAYVELFTPFTQQPHADHRLYTVSRRIADGGHRIAAILPATDICRSVHLYPKFGPVAPREWTSSTVLDLASHFYANPWTDRHAYITIQ